MTILDPHLDLDQVSAAVDGERDPAVAAHLLVCLACRRQVDTWQAALGSLRDLPSAPDADVAVARALATWTPVAGSSPAPGSLSPRGSVSPLASPVDGPQSLRSGRKGSAGPARRLLHLRPPPGVAAALMIAVLLAATVLGVAHLSHGQNSAKASSTAAPTSAGAAAPSGRSAVPSHSPPSFGRTGQLAAQLRRATAPSGASSGAGSGGGAGTVGPHTPCLRQVDRIARTRGIAGADTPYFDETVRLSGVPSQVFAFTGANGPVALVVRSRTCSLLATVLF